MSQSLTAEEETRLLLLKIVEQAVRDYETYKNKKTSEDQAIFNNAKQFLFNPDYLIQWGDFEIGFSDICEYLELDFNWAKVKLLSHLDGTFLDLLGIIIPEVTI